MRACVIGAGLAGLAAALTLREGGAEVEVISRAPGASALGGGTLDFAGASPASGASPARDRNGAWLAPTARIGELLARNPTHPYHLLLEPGREHEQVREAIRALNDWLGREGLGAVGRLDRPMLLADTQGALRVGDCALPSVAAGDLKDVSEVALVAWPGLNTWNHAAVAERIEAEVHALRGEGLSVTLVDAEWPPPWCAAGRAPARLAALLDDPGALPVLREVLKPAAADRRLLLLPPVLGLDPKNPVREALAQALGCPVAECAGVPPLHLAGVRLQRAALTALDRAGIPRIQAEVTGVRPGAPGEALEIAIGDSEPTDPTAVAPGRTTRYQAAVMATGRFVGGGLCEGENGLEEPILGLALHDARGRRADGESAQFLSNPDYEAPQPLYSAGVKVDRHLRPLDGAGRPAALHLYAAGELIGGFDPALDRSGYGVALLSGMRAGAEALHAALDPS